MCARCFGYDFEDTGRIVGDPAGSDFLSQHRASQGGGRDGVPGIVAATATGITAVDALLRGNAWNVSSLSFSFPTDASQYTDYIFSGTTETSTFSPLSLEFREAIRQILGGGTLEGGGATFSFGSVASLTNLAFTEAAGGDGDMRFAFSDAPSVAWGYYPWPNGGEGGDAWFNSGYMGLFATPVPGSYTWATAVHEIGHTLGLKHGHEVGGLINAAVPAEMDSLEFTIMTYRSYVGDDTSGYNNEQFGFPQTFMMLDIRALQQMYGADFTVNSGDTTYTWNPTTGEMSVNGVAQGAPGANRVFLTIWDGNGEDTYDLSNYGSGVTIDLTPGGYSLFSDAQRAYLGNGHYARGNVFNALQYNGDTRSLIENAIGGAGDDTIVGNQAANRLEGGAGRDLLLGGDGDDTLLGGSGVDRIEGGAGADVLDGGSGVDTLIYSNSDAGVTVRLGMNTASGGHAEGDTISNFERLRGSAFNDTLIGSNGDNLIRGGDGKDYLNGLKGEDSLYGEAGDDRIEGGGGADILDGGDGIDTLLYVSSTKGVTVRLSTGVVSGGHANGDTISNFENVTGSAFNDTLIGSIGANVLVGGAGDDYLDGIAGDDILIGGAGADRLKGGAGFDIASYADSGTRVVVRLGLGTASGGHANGDTLMDIEGLIGSAFNDTLIGSDLDNSLVGGDGDDYLDGLLGADTLNGGAGDDRISGGGGGDVLIGGAGVDTLIYAASKAAVTVRLSNNTASGGHANGDIISGFENVTGSAFNDTLIGSSVANTLLGGDGDDYLDGLAGNDILNGGAGNDRLKGGAGADLFVFEGASGADRIIDFEAGAAVSDVIRLDSNRFADFADVLAHTADDGLGNTVISKSGVTITLQGVLKAQLHANDFAFVAPGAPLEVVAGAGGIPVLEPKLEDEVFGGGRSGDLAGWDGRAAPEAKPDMIWIDALIAPEAVAAPDAFLGDVFARPAFGGREALLMGDYDWIF